MGTPTTQPPKPPTRAGSVVVPHPAKWHGKLAAAAIFASVRSLDATLRYRLEDPSDALAAARQQPVIFAIWHNRLSLCLMLYHRYIQQRMEGRRMAAIVSASKDGGMLARVLDHFGVQPVRGSTSRRGAQALRELTSWAAQGYDLAITPDGPRGPRYRLQEGVIGLAGITGLPILPVCYHLVHKHQLSSWDRFQFPFPFTTCTVSIGSMVKVPANLDEAGREQWRQQVEQAMLAITRD